MQIQKYAKKDKMGGGGSNQKTKEVKTEQVTGLQLMRLALPLLVILTKDKHMQRILTFTCIPSFRSSIRVVFIAYKKKSVSLYVGERESLTLPNHSQVR